MADQSSPHFPMLKIHRNGPCRHMYLDSRAGPTRSRGCEALGSQVHSGVGRKARTGWALVSAVAKRGTVTPGKPGIMREAAIACAT